MVSPVRRCCQGTQQKGTGESARVCGVCVVCVFIIRVLIFMYCFLSLSISISFFLSLTLSPSLFLSLSISISLHFHLSPPPLLITHTLAPHAVVRLIVDFRVLILCAWLPRALCLSADVAVLVALFRFSHTFSALCFRGVSCCVHLLCKNMSV